jgi:hypothetical protein
MQARQGLKEVHRRNVLPLTAQDFDSTVAQSTCLVVEFSASLEEFADRASEVEALGAVRWAHVDLTTETKLAQTFGIDTDAALLIFREQIVLYLEAGKHDPARIAGLLRRILALDMPAIRAEIEAQKQAELALRMRRVCPTARRGRIEG